MKHKLLTLFIGLTFSSVFSQTNHSPSAAPSRDSLSGFDETAFAQFAAVNHYTALEYQRMLAKMKRDFVTRKYKLSLPVIAAKVTTPPGSLCDNLDFEQSLSTIVTPAAIQGWTVQSGTHLGVCLTPTYSGSSNYTVYPAGVFDPLLGVMVSSYFSSASTATGSGASFIKLNDSQAWSETTTLSKSFIVTANDSVLEYAFLPVLENGGHNCCDQSKVIVNVTVTNTLTNTFTVLACPNMSYSVPGVLCATGYESLLNPANGAGWFYSDWHAYVINLKPYLNHRIDFEFSAKDCGAGGHAGYAYFDARCGGSLHNHFTAGTSAVSASYSVANLFVCSFPVTVNVPFNYAQGSNGAATFSYVPSFSLSQAAMYTFSLLPGLECEATTQTLNISLDTPTTTITYITTQVCLGSAVSLTASGTTFQWSTGDTTAVIQVTPNAASTIYSVTTMNNNGCTSGQSVQLFASVCTGIAAVEKQEMLRLYPNPNAGQFTIEANTPVTVCLYNELGMLVLERNVASGSQQLDLSQFADGIYTAKLVSGDQLKTLRLVKVND